MVPFTSFLEIGQQMTSTHPRKRLLHFRTIWNRIEYVFTPKIISPIQKNQPLQIIFGLENMLFKQLHCQLRHSRPIWAYSTISSEYLRTSEYFELKSFSTSALKSRQILTVSVGILTAVSPQTLL